MPQSSTTRSRPYRWDPPGLIPVAQETGANQRPRRYQLEQVIAFASLFSRWFFCAGMRHPRIDDKDEYFAGITAVSRMKSYALAGPGASHYTLMNGLLDVAVCQYLAVPLFGQVKRSMGRKCVAGKSARRAACLGVLLLATLSGRFAYTQNAAPRDQAEAWKWMQELLKNAEVSNPTLNNGVVRGKVKDGDFTIDLATVTSVAPYAPEPGFQDVYNGRQWYAFPDMSSTIGHATFHAAPLPGQVYRINADAQRFQAALVYLARQAQQEQAARDAADLESFKPKAIAWRQLAVKPAMPEEAQRHEVLAEYAYKNKDIPKAILEYEAALSIFPYWPDGHSNLANLAAAVGTRPGYNMAVYHMKMYLMLVPNAPDAKAAQDSIFIWEDKRNSATP